MAAAIIVDCRALSPRQGSIRQTQPTRQQPAMSEEHGTLIKTPKQLIVVAALALITPVTVAILGSQLATSAKRIDTAESKRLVIERIKPVGTLVSTEGAAADTNANAASAAPAAAAAPAVAAKAKTGDQVFNESCVACHGTGIAGAPKAGDKAAWAPRLAEGAATLYDHAIKGFKTMPARGGAATLSDAEVKAAVDVLIAKAK